MSEFDKYEYKNKIEDDNNTINEPINEPIDESIYEPKREFYYETIKDHNQPEPKKSPWLKFIIGVMIISLVGGGAIGASFSVLQPLVKQFIAGKTAEDIVDHIEEEKPKFEFTDEVKDVVVNPSSGSPVVQIAKKVGAIRRIHH